MSDATNATCFVIDKDGNRVPDTSAVSTQPPVAKPAAQPNPPQAAAPAGKSTKK